MFDAPCFPCPKHVVAKGTMDATARKQNLLPVTVKTLPVWNHQFQTALPYLEDGFDYPVFGVKTVKELVKKIEHFYDTQSTWIVQYETKAIGVFALGKLNEEHDNAPGFVETAIYIHPEYRRKKIASTLTYTAALSALKTNLPFMVEVRTDNSRSISTHKTVFPDTELIPAVYPDFEAWQWRNPEPLTTASTYYHPWLGGADG